MDILTQYSTNVYAITLYLGTKVLALIQLTQESMQDTTISSDPL